MKIFISGNPRTGKTSLVKRIIEEFGRENFFGFWTEEVKENKRRVGFDIVTTWGERYILARTYIRTPYRVGRYFVVLDNIEKVSKEVLDKLESIKKIIVIDEIGPMEFYSNTFKNLVNIVLKKEIPLLAVVHRKYVNIAPYYYWLEIGNWWEVYKNVKKNIKEILQTFFK